MLDSVLILGGGGFLGNVLVDTLIHNGFKVYVLVRDETKSNITNNSKKKIVSFKTVCTQDFFTKHKIDFIINALANYGRHGETDIEIVESNFGLPQKILKLSNESNVRCFINIDTFYVSEMGLEHNLKLYVDSKKKFVSFGKKFADEKKIKFINATLHHMYGPGDKSSKFIPYLVSELQKDSASMNLTGGRQRRDFIHVNDVATALLTIINNYSRIKENLEIGTGNSIELKSVIEKLRVLCEANTVLNFGVIPYRENECMDSRADVSELKEYGWEPSFEVDAGLKDCVKK